MRKKTILDARIDVKIDCIYKIESLCLCLQPQFSKSWDAVQNVGKKKFKYNKKCCMCTSASTLLKLLHHLYRSNLIG